MAIPYLVFYAARFKVYSTFEHSDKLRAGGNLGNVKCWQKLLPYSMANKVLCEMGGGKVPRGECPLLCVSEIKS